MTELVEIMASRYGVEDDVYDRVVGTIVDCLSSNVLTEFDYVILPTNEDVVCVENKLGVNIKLVKPLFKSCLQAMKAMKESSSSKMDALTKVLLLLRGDNPMFFNKRKELINDGHTSVEDELYFTSVLFTKHPKSPSGWQHRRWLLQQNLRNINTTNELALCSHMAEKYPKNYYAWMHRLWLLNHMNEGELKGELGFTSTWLTTHVSDHSCMNHRQQIANRLLQNESGASGRLVLLLSMLTENKQCILVRPGSETLWYHRRGLVTSLLQLYQTLPHASDDRNIEIENSLSLHTKIDEMAEKHPIEELLDTIDSPCQVDTLTCYIDTMLTESQFTSDCIHNESLWNHKQQKLYAYRYQLHMLQQAVRYLPSTFLFLRIECERSSKNIAQELHRIDTFPRIWKHKMM